MEWAIQIIACQKCCILLCMHLFLVYIVFVKLAYNTDAASVCSETDLSCVAIFLSLLIHIYLKAFQ